MWARAAVAALSILGGSGLANGTESNVTGSYRQAIRANVFGECRNVQETYGKDLSGVEGVSSDIPHVSRHNADAQLVSLGVMTFFRWRYLYGTPAPTVVNLGGSEGVVKRRATYFPFTRKTKFGIGNSVGNDGFKPFIGIEPTPKVSADSGINDVSSRCLTDIPGSDLDKERQIISLGEAVRAQYFNLTIQGGFNRNPWPQVASSDIAGMSKRFGTFLHSTLRRESTKASGFGSLTSIVKGRDYEDNPDSTDPPCCARPEGLVLGSPSGAPLDAKLGLMLVLGGLAGVLINECGIRGFHNRSQGWWLLILGMACLIGGFIAALLFA